MSAKLYVVQGSHPCATAERALALKGLSYQRVELVELAHMPLQRLRFGAPTVPGMVFEDGEKVLGSRAIVHRLDERVANPPLFPSDPHERARVEELERWGDKKLQSLARHPKEDMAHSLWRSRFGALETVSRSGRRWLTPRRRQLLRSQRCVRRRVRSRGRSSIG